MGKVCRRCRSWRQATVRSLGHQKSDLTQRRKDAKKSRKEDFDWFDVLCVFAPLREKPDSIAKTTNNRTLASHRSFAFCSVCRCPNRAFNHESRSTIVVGQTLDQSDQASGAWCESSRRAGKDFESGDTRIGSQG